ncbi:MAG: C40 family peptidase [Cyclobacteriaceae bacterium]|jgi:cell wall-associated NlpC family hydrolase|nr:C40 family peptidase [Cyclobacteriaceae bacterium]
MLLIFRLKGKQRFQILFLFALLIFSSCASHKARVRDERVAKVIETARTYTGTPYKYGGTTRSGMDCSALMIHSFRSLEVNLPRSTEAQSKVGTEIKIKKVQPGDLLFFATGKKKREITHVGLVTEKRSSKDIKFIHASTSLGVVEDNLFSSYYRPRFRQARRLID